jgi:Rho-binding antiterminator
MSAALFFFGRCRLFRALLLNSLLGGGFMADERYEPVSCDYHDQLEAAAVQKREVEIEFDDRGVRQRERGRVGDVYSADGAEFVRFDADNGSVEVRLDHIVSLKEL